MPPIKEMVSLNRVLLAGELVENPTLDKDSEFSTFKVHCREPKSLGVIVPVLARGQLAENIAKFLKKGSNVMVEGKLASNRATFPNGKTVDFIQINASSVVFMESKRTGE